MVRVDKGYVAINIKHDKGLRVTDDKQMSVILKMSVRKMLRLFESQGDFIKSGDFFVVKGYYDFKSSRGGNRVKNNLFDK